VCYYIVKRHEEWYFWPEKKNSRDKRSSLFCFPPSLTKKQVLYLAVAFVAVVVVVVVVVPAVVFLTEFDTDELTDAIAIDAGRMI
jgi:hypothetical protein